MVFANLLDELLVLAIRQVEDAGDLARLARTCRRVYHLANHELYRAVRHRVDLMCWAVRHQPYSEVKNLLEAGPDPDAAWVTTNNGNALLELTPCFKNYSYSPEHHCSGLGPHFKDLWAYGDQYHKSRTSLICRAQFGLAGNNLSCYPSWTPLHVAANIGADRIISSLVTPNQADSSGTRPLQVSVRKNYTEEVQSMLKALSETPKSPDALCDVAKQAKESYREGVFKLLVSCGHIQRL